MEVGERAEEIIEARERKKGGGKRINRKEYWKRETK